MKKINIETIKSKTIKTFFYNVRDLKYIQDEEIFNLSLYENIFITNKTMELKRDNLLLSMNNFQDLAKLARLEKLVDDYFNFDFKFKDDNQKHIWFNEPGVYMGRIDLEWEYRAYDEIKINSRVIYFLMFIFKSVYNNKYRKFEIYKMKNKLILTMDNINKKSGNKLYMVI